MEIKVSRQFSDNFRMVSEFYGCTDAEIAEMKEAARSDLANAEIAFQNMAEQIAAWNK
ncbi:MAG: hypothetical protein ACYC4K_08270 [Thiobacillus sp.]